jgi:hypothetical protein
MSWHSYQKDLDVHVFDCSGSIDLATGLARLARVDALLHEHPPKDGIRRLVLDFRDTHWDDEQTHRALSVATRERFLDPANPDVRVAIVNNRWSGAISKNERWFENLEDAFRWLE